MRRSALLIALPFVVQMSFGVALFVVGPTAIVMSAGIKKRLDIVGVARRAGSGATFYFTLG